MLLNPEIVPLYGNLPSRVPVVSLDNVSRDFVLVLNRHNIRQGRIFRVVRCMSNLQLIVLPWYVENCTEILHFRQSM